MAGDNLAEATTTTRATFQINNAKLYVQEYLKQVSRRTISWNKYRSEISTKPKNYNLDCMTDPIFRNVNRLFALSFKNGDDDPTKNCSDEYYLPLFEIKDFNAVIDNEPFLISP